MKKNEEFIPVAWQPEHSKADLALIEHFRDHRVLVNQIAHNLEAYGSPEKGYILTGDTVGMRTGLRKLSSTLQEIIRQLDESGSCIIQSKQKICPESLSQPLRGKRGRKPVASEL